MQEWITNQFMSTQNTNITEKKYKKLSIQVSLTGLSFVDTLNNTIPLYEVQFDSFHKGIKSKICFRMHFRDYPELNGNMTMYLFYTITICPHLSLSSFDENMGSYLQYNTKVLKLIFCI
jgi:hypothetical protein